jgi:hypothetical protein
MFNLGSTVSSFAFDPAHRDVIYAGTAAVWQSRDRGRTWRMTFPRPDSAHVSMQGDHAEYTLRSDDPLFPQTGGRASVQALAVASDGTVAAAIAGGRAAHGTSTSVLVSAPDGEHWRKLRDLPPGRVLALAYGPAGHLALVTERQVFVLRGGTWVEHSGPASSSMRAASVVVDRSGNAVVYGLTETEEAAPMAGGLFVSRDGGAAWTRVTDAVLGGSPALSGRRRTRFTAVSAFPHGGLTAYVGIEGLAVAQDGDSTVARANGIARTDDGGRSWP